MSFNPSPFSSVNPTPTTKNGQNLEIINNIKSCFSAISATIKDRRSKSNCRPTMVTILAVDFENQPDQIAYEMREALTNLQREFSTPVIDLASIEKLGTLAGSKEGIRVQIKFGHIIPVKLTENKILSLEDFLQDLPAIEYTKHKNQESSN